MSDDLIADQETGGVERPSNAPMEVDARRTDVDGAARQRHGAISCTMRTRRVVVGDSRAYLTIDFQRFPTSVGESTRQERDMKRCSIGPRVDQATLVGDAVAVG